MAETADSQALRGALRALLLTRLGDSPGAVWLRELTVPADLDAVRPLLLQVGRHVGRHSLVASFVERGRSTVQGVFGPLRIGHWNTDGAARCLIVAEAADRAESPYAALFRTYDLGDTETRVAALRAINFVREGDPEPALEMVRDAGRTYLNELMEAGWLDSPFAARHLSPQEYRKAVLKGFFCGLPVERFEGLEQHADAELSDSLCQYADEREAAGRPVPVAVWPIAALHPRAGLVARLIGKLEHPLPEERLTAARALGNARDPRTSVFLTERLSRETNPDVAGAITAALSRLSASA